MTFKINLTSIVKEEDKPKNKEEELKFIAISKGFLPGVSFISPHDGEIDTIRRNLKGTSSLHRLYDEFYTTDMGDELLVYVEKQYRSKNAGEYVLHRGVWGKIIDKIENDD